MGTKISALPSASTITGSELIPIVQYGVTSKVAISSFSREKLTGTRTYYVRTDGSDSNTGLANTSSDAFLTIQKAIDTLANNVDLNGNTAVIQVADGTYTAGGTISAPWVGEGDVYIFGNLTTPSNCVINAASADGFALYNHSRANIQGFKITTTTSGSSLRAYTGSILAFGAIDFGACASSHVECGTGGTIVGGGNYSITGGGVSHLHCGSQGTITLGTITVTLTGTPAFSAYFAGVALGSITAMTTTWTGSATGTRWIAHKGGVIDVGTGGLTTLPGNAAGVTDVGGTYSMTTGTQDTQYFGGTSTGYGLKVVGHTSGQNGVTITPGANPTIGADGGNFTWAGAQLITGSSHSLYSTATPAGGGVGTGWFIGLSAIGIYFGSGAPTVAAARGSLYIRTDNGANTSLYINRDGGTTWAAVTSA